METFPHCGEYILDGPRHNHEEIGKIFFSHKPIFAEINNLEGNLSGRIAVSPDLQQARVYCNLICGNEKQVIVMIGHTLKKKLGRMVCAILCSLLLCLQHQLVKF